MNNLRIVLKRLLYSKANEFHLREVQENPGLRDLLRRSGFRLDIPVRQVNYMLTPSFINQARFRRARRLLDFRDELFQYKFKLSFCFDDEFSLAERTLLLTHARDLLAYVHHYLMMDFNDATNSIGLKMLMFTPQSFVGLYEALYSELQPGYSLRDVVSSGSVVLSRWSSYYVNLGRFFQDWYLDFRAQLGTLNPNFPVQQVEEEIQLFEDTHVIESPGLSLAALIRLLGVESERVKKVFLVNWNVRLGLKVNGRVFRDSWLENVNLQAGENDVSRVNQWRGDIGYRD